MKVGKIGFALMVTFLPSIAFCDAGRVTWSNATQKEIAVSTIDTLDDHCPPDNPGGTHNFRLLSGDSHPLDLVDNQFFCWTWRFNDDQGTEPGNWCKATGGDDIKVNESSAPANMCKEVPKP